MELLLFTFYYDIHLSFAIHFYISYQYDSLSCKYIVKLITETVTKQGKISII